MQNGKTLPPEITFERENGLEILAVSHPTCTAKVALQGAHLFHWQPSHTHQPVLWLSEIEPFKAGNAIRGGVPICYPHFGVGLDGTKSPFHGTARISRWDLVDYAVNENGVYLAFQFVEDASEKAKVEMYLGETAEIRFTQLDDEPSQLALHSYFQLADIAQTTVSGLPTRCFDKLTNSEQAVENPRKIAENVDCIYRIEQPISVINDLANQRQIHIEHTNAGEIVLWNPWHKPTGGMSEQGYRTMVCVETARIYRLLAQAETVSVKISVK